MNSFPIAPAEPKLPPEASAAFSVVMAYDDAIAGRTAPQLYRRLVGQFGIESEFDYHSWNFQELKDSSTAQEATRSGAGANLIIVATVNSGLMSGQIKGTTAFSREDLSKRYKATSSVLEEILNRPPPPPRWGINE